MESEEEAGIGEGYFENLRKEFHREFHCELAAEKQQVA
jgi:hypothetical protein